MISLVKFYSDTCGPCKSLQESLDKYLEAYPGIELSQVNAPKNMDLVLEHQIQGVPTLLVFNDRLEIKRIVGNAHYKALETTLNELRNIQPDVLQEQSEGSEDTGNTLLSNLSESKNTPS